MHTHAGRHPYQKPMTQNRELPTYPPPLRRRAIRTGSSWAVDMWITRSVIGDIFNELYKGTFLKSFDILNLRSVPAKPPARHDMTRATRHDASDTAHYGAVGSAARHGRLRLRLRARRGRLGRRRPHRDTGHRPGAARPDARPRHDSCHAHTVHSRFFARPPTRRRAQRRW